MSEMVPLYGFGGSGGGSGCTLTVTAPAGATVTISKDGKSKTKVADSSGVAVFKGLSGGEWTVTATDGAQESTKTVTITTDYATLISFNSIPDFTYTGDFEIVNDADEAISISQDNWKIRFLTSGILTITELKGAANGIDVFLVGGGGTGGGSTTGLSSHVGTGGGGGYTGTYKNITLSENTQYAISIGASGGKTSAFDFSVKPGSNGTGWTGGTGGSGGGSMSEKTYTGGSGGSDGSDGGKGTRESGDKISGGSGQGTTTREFGETDGRLYAGGGGASSKAGSGGAGGLGGGGSGMSKASSATSGAGGNGKANTGGGGGGGSISRPGGSGGSGIVIIRNAREVA